MAQAVNNKRAIKYIDDIAGKALRHLVFALVRPYYSIFYNVSCSNKEMLQDLGGAVILANHVSRHDGPLVLATLYAVTRIRPTAYYREYEHWLQKYPMMLFGTVPMSSPKSWEPRRREQQKLKTLDIIRRVLASGNSILIFPAGGIRKGEKEEIASYLTGAYDTIQAVPERPVVLVKIDGLGKCQYRKYDLFWSFLGITNGRRHTKIELEVVENMPLYSDRETFNKNLENYFNGIPLPLS